MNTTTPILDAPTDNERAAILAVNDDLAIRIMRPPTTRERPNRVCSARLTSE